MFLARVALVGSDFAVLTEGLLNLALESECYERQEEIFLVDVRLESGVSEVVRLKCRLDRCMFWH